MPVTDIVRFVNGEYKNMIFRRGTGPTEHLILDGVKRLINSTNFWYSNNLSLSEAYLKSHEPDWVSSIEG